MKLTSDYFLLVIKLKHSFFTQWLLAVVAARHYLVTSECQETYLVECFFIMLCLFNVLKVKHIEKMPIYTNRLERIFFKE